MVCWASLFVFAPQQDIPIIKTEEKKRKLKLLNFKIKGGGGRNYSIFFM